ncbi:MAG: glutamine--tRNA ligase/YqeY domain fusion protein [Clostridia bacterium]
MIEDTNFITDIIEKDLKDGVITNVHTRFPPEPNGYLHIGSAKAILINYNSAHKFSGKFNLRYDDTNPCREDDEYVKSIYEDMVWLGAKPDGGVFFASDYFDKCYEYAVKLIEDGKAYICEQSQEQMRKSRGTLTEKGTNSPYRDRPIKESLELFTKMKNGEFEEGHCVLRAKIDMQSPNLTMRDPAIYRIINTEHHRQGNKWCIYPLYDFAHPIEDAIEGITHSCCSIEFENNRPLYNWVIDNIGVTAKPHQYEFSRLNMTYTVMSKRYLRTLVETKTVDGWDDPRMPTLSGLRRRGYSASSINSFISKIGVSKASNMVDIELLEFCIRDELNKSAERKMAVLDPILIEITNYDENEKEYFEISNNPSDENSGSRKVAFTKYIYIDKADFSENPPPKYFRLKRDGEVRLAGAYIIKFEEIVYKENGEIEKILCSCDLETKNNKPVDGRKVKGTVHWVSASDCCSSTVRVYDRLFTRENLVVLDENENFLDFVNKESLTIYENAKLEKSLENAKPMDKFQFVRTGYFCKDEKLENTYNSIVTLKDSYKG